MGLEEGNEKDLNGPKAPSGMDAATAKIIEEMQSKIAELQKNNQPAPTSISGATPDQFALLVAEIAKAVKTRPEADALTVRNFVAERDIDPDDWDAKGVRFSAFGTGYVIVDDKRNGFPVSTPFGNVLVFTYTGSRRGNRDDKGMQELATFCSYVSHSKKEQQWLRDHRMFGVKIFESTAAALSVNAERAQMLSRFIDSLAAQDQNQVLGQCQAAGIPITGNMREMRIALAEQMVDKQFQTQKASTQRVLEENFEEKTFLNEKTTVTTAQLQKKF